MVTTESGLQYKDIKVGEGPSPPIGFQVSYTALYKEQFLQSNRTMMFTSILETLNSYSIYLIG